MTDSDSTLRPVPPGDFAGWSLDAQKALYRELAAEALELWGLQVSGISWLSYSSNAVLAVKTTAKRYILRLSLPSRVRESQLRSELSWLRSIQQRTDLLAPKPVALTLNGKARFYASAPHKLLPPPHRVYCALFEHIDGRQKSAGELSAADCNRIGRYLGRLHQDAQFDPPAGFDRPRLDQRGLFGSDSPYQSARESQALEAGQREVFARAAGRVSQVMARLDRQPSSFGLIHADLLAKNVLFDGGRIAALDFEYSGWAYFLYDLAPLLWQLRGERSADYAQLERALLAGYQSARPAATIDRDALEAFLAARQLASCRWLLQNLHHPKVRDLAPALIHQRTAELAAFLSSGKLKRQSPTL